MNSKITYLKKLELYKELDNYKDGQFFAIADQKVKNHLPQWIQFSPHVFWLKSPEEEKNLTVYGQIIDFLLKGGIQRSSKIYAFGGGATTDIAGFVASTILRGIPWCAIPTTLLAMIDGSIGGKVGINMPQGKNQVGAFHAPDEVFICGDFLTTLPEREWVSGRGEILKYGFLSEEIHQLILKKAPIETIAHACAVFKTKIVEKDFREEGDRIHLNLGHTLGHAFESHLKISHGHAVAMGLYYLFKVLNQSEPLAQWEKMAKALSLPAEKYKIDHFPLFDIKAFISYVEHDKKKIDTHLRLVLVKAIGSCYVEEILMKDFKKKIQAYEEFKT
jgi:3-dehydroquinate synthase